ncbi:MAG TPA: hypothetical protein ENK60_01100 [Anaerolineae bacterium]|nr:hypothetical protein [Anaerolineae bacterium]
MYAIDIRLIEKLDEEDQEKVAYFLKLLLEQSKYRRTNDELRERREEIERGETLTHEEIWAEFDV